MVQKQQFCLSPAPFDEDPVANEERDSIDYSIKITTDMIKVGSLSGICYPQQRLLQTSMLMQ